MSADVLHATSTAKRLEPDAASRTARETCPPSRDASVADGSTFAPGLALLPHRVKADVERFYGVLRTIDDLVDEDDPCAEQRVMALEDWARRLASASPEARALDELDARVPLPRRWLLHFCAGMRHDLMRAVVRTDADFDRYCHEAGGSVGIVLAHLLGADGIGEAPRGMDGIGEAPRRSSATRGDRSGMRFDRTGASGDRDRRRRALSRAETGMETLGRAMQVTNIARDIDEDLADGRLYIPTSLIERHGFPAPGAREQLLRELITRADALYEEGETAIPLLRDGRRAMALATALYREILRQIERDGFGARAGRVVVPAWRTRQIIVEHRYGDYAGSS